MNFTRELFCVKTYYSKQSKSLNKISIYLENYIAIEKKSISGSSEDQIINWVAVNDARRNGIPIPPYVTKGLSRFGLLLRCWFWILL